MLALEYLLQNTILLKKKCKNRKLIRTIKQKQFIMIEEIIPIEWFTKNRQHLKKYNLIFIEQLTNGNNKHMFNWTQIKTLFLTKHTDKQSKWFNQVRDI